MKHQSSGQNNSGEHEGKKALDAFETQSGISYFFNEEEM